MALNTAGLQLAANGLKSGITHFSIHTANPGTNGANESTAARRPVTLVESGGDLTVSNVQFTGGAASGPAPFVGYWSAATGGTFYGSKATTGDQTFNAAGELTLTNFTMDLTSPA